MIVAAGAFVSSSGRTISLRDDVDRMLAATKLYRPADCADVVDAVKRAPTSAGAGTATRIEVTNETTAAATRRLARDGCHSVACLNFASARTPGGGYRSGARAQEEDLARKSALAAYLESAVARPYYEAKRAHASLLYTDHLVWTPAVPFFRDDDLALVDDVWHAHVVTSPAPNRGALLARIDSHAPLDVEDAERSIVATLRRRAEHVVAVLAKEGAKNVVLGAWGCGVFKNDPVVVADVLAQVLERYRAFERVVFAVFDPSSSQPSLRAFTERFA